MGRVSAREQGSQIDEHVYGGQDGEQHKNKEWINLTNTMRSSGWVRRKRTLERGKSQKEPVTKTLYSAVASSNRELRRVK